MREFQVFYVKSPNIHQTEKIAKFDEKSPTVAILINVLKRSIKFEKKLDSTKRKEGANTGKINKSISEAAQWHCLSKKRYGHNVFFFLYFFRPGHFL